MPGSKRDRFQKFFYPLSYGLDPTRWTSFTPNWKFIWLWIVLRRGSSSALCYGAAGAVDDYPFTCLFHSHRDHLPWSLRHFHRWFAFIPSTDFFICFITMRKAFTRKKTLQSFLSLLTSKYLFINGTVDEHSASRLLIIGFYLKNVFFSGLISDDRTLAVVSFLFLELA